MIRLEAPTNYDSKSGFQTLKNANRHEVGRSSGGFRFSMPTSPLATDEPHLASFDERKLDFYGGRKDSLDVGDARDG